MSAFPLVCNIAHTRRYGQARKNAGLRSISEPNYSNNVTTTTATTNNNDSSDRKGAIKSTSMGSVFQQFTGGYPINQDHSAAGATLDGGQSINQHPLGALLADPCDHSSHGKPVATAGYWNPFTGVLPFLQQQHSPISASNSSILNQGLHSAVEALPKGSGLVESAHAPAASLSSPLGERAELVNEAQKGLKSPLLLDMFNFGGMNVPAHAPAAVPSPAPGLKRSGSASRIKQERGVPIASLGQMVN